jgi:hypothetical protein
MADAPAGEAYRIHVWIRQISPMIWRRRAISSIARAQATQCRSHYSRRRRTSARLHLARDAPALPTSRQVPLTIVRTAGPQAIRERIGGRRDLFCGAKHRVEYLGLGAAFATYVDPLRT